MKEKATPILMLIALPFFLGMILFIFQTCKKDSSIAEQATTDQPDSFRIPSLDQFPYWSPDGTKIAFQSNRDGNWEIYTMNSDGSDQTRLTDNPADDERPSWSPDGTRIAFQSNRDGNYEIYSMNPDGTKQTRWTDNPSDERRVSWSSDSQKIVFASNRDGNWEIYTMNTDGSQQIRLIDNPAPDGQPSWSPDGSRIVFASLRDGNSNIYVMNTDGSNQMRLTDNPARDMRPSWSPDGTRIVFDSNRDDNWEVYAMNTDGSDQKKLTSKLGNYYPSWSPDGTKIAFNSDRNFDDEVYVMNADGSNQINLTNNAPVNEAFGLAPLPQSELNLDGIPYKIVFETLRETNGKENWEICLIDADGSGFVNLTNTPDIDEMYPHASPNGSQLCFEVVEGTDRENKNRNIYVMNIDGTDRMKIAENANQPCWSPDGKSIAYLPGEFPRYNPNMWANKGLVIYDLETKKPNQHPNREIQQCINLSWSPDGEWLTAVRRGGGGTPNSGVALRADSKEMIGLTFTGCRLDISPDGKLLTWNKTDFALLIGDLNFGSPKRSITNHRIAVSCDRDHWVYHSDWSPDGNYFAFSYAPVDGNEGVGQKAPGSNICICDLRTGKWTQITTDGKHNKEPDWVFVKK